MHFNGIISELDLKIIDFNFTLAYLDQQFHFKANCVFVSVYCATMYCATVYCATMHCAIFKGMKIIVG